jgi:hypothetical protein
LSDAANMGPPDSWLADFDKRFPTPEARQARLARMDPAKAALTSVAYENYKAQRPPLEPIPGQAPDALNSMGRGFEEEATFGLADEMRGVGGAVGMGAGEQTATMGPLNALFPGAAILNLQRRGAEEAYRRLFTDEEQLPFGTEYGVHRDASNDAREAAKNANPGMYKLGQGTGIAAGVAAPIGATATGLKGAIGTGAAMGAVSGAGTSEADLLKDEWGDFAKDTLISGGLGGAFGVAGYGISKAVPWVANKFKRAANTQAFRGTDPALADELHFSPEQQQDIGRAQLDEGIAVPFGSIHGAAARTSKQRELAESAHEALMPQLDSAMPEGIELGGVADRLEKELIPRFEPSTDGDLINLVQNQIDDIRFRGREKPSKRYSVTDGTPGVVKPGRNQSISIDDGTPNRAVRRTVTVNDIGPNGKPVTRSYEVDDEVRGAAQRRSYTAQGEDDVARGSRQERTVTGDEYPTARWTTDGPPKRPRVSPSTLENIKTRIGKKTKFEQAVPTRQTEAFKQLYGALREDIEKQISGKVSGKLAKDFTASKQRLSNLYASERIAEKGAARARKNLPVGLFDVAAGAVGGNTPTERAAFVMASRLIRGRGNQTAAVAFDMLSELLGPQAAEEVVRNLIVKGVVNAGGSDMQEMLPE